MCVRSSDMVGPEAEHGESPPMLAEKQTDLLVVRVGVQGLVVLLVLHLVLGGVAALLPSGGLGGAGLRGALLAPLGASVLEPHLEEGAHLPPQSPHCPLSDSSSLSQCLHLKADFLLISL